MTYDLQPFWFVHCPDATIMTENVKIKNLTVKKVQREHSSHTVIDENRCFCFATSSQRKTLKMEVQNNFARVARKNTLYDYPSWLTDI